MNTKHLHGIIALLCLLASFTLLICCGGRVVRTIGRLGGAKGMSEEAISLLPSFRYTDGGPEAGEVRVSVRGIRASAV